jgi:hypothetical protein
LRVAQFAQTPDAHTPFGLEPPLSAYGAVRSSSRRRYAR